MVETPEGIDLNAVLAGPVSRILAYLTDISIRSMVLMVLFPLSLLIGKAGMGIFLLITFLLEWFYPVIFEVYFKGQTPGKKID